MVELPPPLKNHEQDSLLKLESGIGDDGLTLPLTTWNVAYTSKNRKSWIDRWPEVVSACWMAGMLLCIFALIIYGLGSLGVIRRKPHFTLNCTIHNNSKPANEVHYHYLIEDGIKIPFEKLTKYLDFMRTEYPGLRFNVIFLINNGYRRIFPYQRDDQMRELQSFQNNIKKYHNINVAITTLTNYLSETPWGYKSKHSHLSNLIFYLRVFSVWKHGGIAMQLGSYSDLYTLRTVEGSAVDTILRKYSDGDQNEEVVDANIKLYRDEQNESVQLFHIMLQKLLNKTNHAIKILRPIIPTLRYKRELLNASVHIPEVDKVNITEDTRNNTRGNTVNGSETKQNNLIATEKLLSLFNKTDMKSTKTKESNFTKNLKMDSKIPIIESGVPPLLIFSFLYDDMGPSYYISPTMLPPPIFPGIFESRNRPEIVATSPKRNSSSYALTMALDGSFAATYAKNHPVLRHIMSIAFQRTAPRSAIQDAISNHCSSSFFSSIYCSNINLI